MFLSGLYWATRLQWRGWLELKGVFHLFSHLEQINLVYQKSCAKGAQTSCSMFWKRWQIQT